MRRVLELLVWELKDTTRLYVFVLASMLYAFIYREAFFIVSTSSAGSLEAYYTSFILFAYGHSLRSCYLVTMVISVVLFALMFTYEFESGFARILLANPLRRAEVFAAKILAAIVIIVSSNFVSFLAITLTIMHFEYHIVVGVASFFVPIFLLFALVMASYACGLSVLSSVIVQRSTVAIVLGFILLYLPYAIASSLKPLQEYTSPFNLISALLMMEHGQSPLISMLYSLFVALPTYTIAYLVFRRRDVS